MNLIIILLICFVFSSHPDTLNKIIGDRGFELKFGYSPTIYDKEQERIISHLEFVLDSLMEVSTKDLNESQAKNRIIHINSLKNYIESREFPLNNKFKNRTPIFVDENNTHCAVAHILKQDNQHDIINQVINRSNYDYIEDMNLNSLKHWLKNSGISFNELKLIQPAYKHDKDGQQREIYLDSNRREKEIYRIKPYFISMNNKNISYSLLAKEVNIDSIFSKYEIELNPWYDWKNIFTNPKDLQVVTIEVSSSSNKKLFNHLKKTLSIENQPYTVKVQVEINKYGNVYNVIPLSNIDNRFINRFTKKILRKSKWSPSIKITKFIYDTPDNGVWDGPEEFVSGDGNDNYKSYLQNNSSNAFSVQFVLKE